MPDTPENASNESILGRRSYLKAAAGATALAALGKSAAASEGEYDVVKVSAGETHIVRLSDGETYENKLIDISADGAGVHIYARGSDMIVRNIAIVGGWDHAPSPSGAFMVEADAGSTVRLENIYADAGEAGNFDPSDNPTGIYTYWSHAGTLEIDRVHLRNFPDNGIYASPAGNPPEHPNEGSNGEVHVTNSYVYDCHTSGIRLGTDGSYAENCVIVDGNHRGYWGYYNHTELIDCDILTGGSRDIQIGGSADWTGHDTAEVTVRETRFDTYNEHQSGNDLHGSSAGSPEHRGPEELGAPKTAEEAASGSSEPPSDPFPGDFTLELTSNDGVSEYLLELDAANVEPGDDANTHDHDYQDRAFEHDGRWYVHGYVGSGGVDDFHVENGEILRVGELEGSLGIRAGRSLVDPAEFDDIESVPDSGDESDEEQEEDEEEESAENHPSGDFVLELSSDEFAEYLLELDAASVEPGDEANTWEHDYQDRAFEHDGRWYVHGYVGSGGVDDFHVEDGEILRVGELEGASRISADGEELGPDEFDDIESVPSQTDDFRALEVAGQFAYRVEVSGEIRPAEEHAEWLTEGEAFGDDWAEWWLSGNDGARTVWEFTGEITELELDDHDDEIEIRTLSVDGEELDRSEYVDTSPKELAVAGQFEYRIEVDGELEPAEEHAEWLTEGEAYGDDWAEWWLSGSSDARTVWLITGEITTLDVSDRDGTTEIRTLTVDGEEIDPNDYS